MPFPDGEHVRISVTAALPRLSIGEVQRLLAGSVDYFDDPGEPIIPIDDADVLKEP